MAACLLTANTIVFQGDEAVWSLYRIMCFAFQNVVIPFVTAHFLAHRHSLHSLFSGIFTIPPHFTKNDNYEIRSLEKNSYINHPRDLIYSIKSIQWLLIFFTNHLYRFLSFLYSNILDVHFAF